MRANGVLAALLWVVVALPGWVQVPAVGAAAAGPAAIGLSETAGREEGVECGGTVALKAGRTGSCKALARQIAAMVAEPAVARAHWGVAVVGMDGTPLYSLNAGQFFQPASNAKLFTTAAAMALLGPGQTFETRVVARGTSSAPDKLTGDLYLVGGGDANLSGRELPYVAPEAGAVMEAPATDPLRYLRELADGVAAMGLKTVSGDVVGDDTLFPYEPYAQDWAIDDAVWGYGAPVSALTINDNQMKLTVTPGSEPGVPATVAPDPAMEAGYYTISGEVSTGVAKSANTVHMERAIGSREMRVYGSIAVDAGVNVEEIAIEDPAELGARMLKDLLEKRGVTITGVARARHLPQRQRRGFLDQVREPIDAGLLDGTLGFGCGDCGRPDLEKGERVLATHRSAPMGEDVVVTNKVSQNLHAELMLHHLGKRLTGVGSTAQGARVVRSFLLRAGLDPGDFVFYDGSGLSGHDLVTPRATVRLLEYATGQPWFAAWKASLPVGGVNGGLAGRFTKAPLKGKVWAKTGTLGEARALSGYVEGASGRTVIFSVMVSTHAPGSTADREVMDRIVAAVAAAE
jgi:D-alanyl-D-alanine carboxypeptidase/D-alanyl-D-alanine-endopeptidase (penicillin-binding protein 4)